MSRERAIGLPSTTVDPVQDREHEVSQKLEEGGHGSSRITGRGRTEMSAPFPDGRNYCGAQDRMADGRMLLRFSVRRLASLPLLALAAGCGTPAAPELPGTLVGESAHFRLFVAPDFGASAVPAYQQGSAGLDALEADWADKQTMLKMPEGQRKIDYHLLTPEQITAACQEDVGSCELGDTLQIATDALPF